MDTDDEEKRLLCKLQKFGLGKSTVPNIKRYLEMGGKTNEMKGLKRKDLAKLALEMEEPEKQDGQMPLAVLMIAPDAEGDGDMELDDSDNTN